MLHAVRFSRSDVCFQLHDSGTSYFTILISHFSFPNAPASFQYELIFQVLYLHTMRIDVSLRTLQFSWVVPYM